MSEVGLEFLENQAGEVEGLGHAGIETFRDTPFVSCSREAGQNTLDAAAGRPVRMVLREHKVRAKEIPGIEKLRETIASCLRAARATGSEKDRDYFENANEVVSREIIPVLEIADYNTTGLEGPPNDNGSKFHALVKSSGKSNKSTETSGGSFGIGKNATFAVSDLRTVFYSTLYDAADGPKFALQGKVQLVSHRDAGGVERTAKGYWGHPKHFMAVEDPALVPEWLRRDAKGTSVFSVGFRGREDWIDRMTVPLLSNFFAAVDDGDIEFEIGDGSRTVNGETLADLLDDAAIEEAGEEASHGDDIRLARQLYRCRKSEEAVTKRFRVDDLGEFRAKILVEEGMPKRVAVVRNGMLIAQSLEHFGDKFARFPGARDFIMLVEPADDEASKVLKSLENPQHNAFSAGRLDDPAKQKKVTRAMKRLIHEIRALIRENAEITGGDAVRLDELGEFFADAGSEEAKVPSAEDDPETIRFTPAKRVRPKPKKPVARQSEGDEGGAGHDEGTGGAGTDGKGGGSGAGEGGEGTRGQQTVVRLATVRNVERSPRVRKVFFTPDEAGEIELTFLATGVYDETELRIANASGPANCAASGGRVELSVDQGSRVEIEVTFDDDYTGPVEIYAVRRAV
ncbi:hypothetical protein [Ovoidimarina sediminis]|uniref:hypothetical protein n=1 Tax=Ovoidimarina sediminis TaxID=3079856 RepID=UPI002915284E|nr:hypothetical protein [Rhodophyticola sp. MJ-SS7]MDU8945986.1 hypothetical protein [Rhodophyticola sp. MJ-SS7]